MRLKYQSPQITSWILHAFLTSVQPDILGDRTIDFWQWLFTVPTMLSDGSNSALVWKMLRISTHKVKPIKTQYGLAAFLEPSNSYTQNFYIKRQAVVLSLFNHQQTQTKEQSNIRSNWRSHVDVTSEEPLRSGLCSWKTIWFYELSWNCILTAVKSF